MVLVGLIIAVTGSAFVYVKNKHLAQEDRKRELEEEIVKFNHDSGQLKQKIQVKMNRHQITLALLEAKSELVEFPAGASTTIPAAPLPGEMDDMERRAN
ncbi:MAG: ribosomal protein L7/L12 [Verrucomicrobiales bacterium]|jgi:ribosomal protein L7/L12